MDWIEVPEQVRRGRPSGQVIDMGPPGGQEASIGRIEVLRTVESSYYAYNTYYKPTKTELEWLNNGGFIEFAQLGRIMQPQSAVVWPPPYLPEDKDADQRPE